MFLPLDARLLCNSSFTLGEEVIKARERTTGTEVLPTMNLCGARGCRLCVGEAALEQQVLAARRDG
jgi:hypothetical protein